MDTYIHQRGVDVVGALAVHGYEERQAPVRRQDVHAAVLVVVPGQQTHAAVLRTDPGGHDVQSLADRELAH